MQGLTEEEKNELAVYIEDKVFHDMNTKPRIRYYRYGIVVDIYYQNTKLTIDIKWSNGFYVIIIYQYDYYFDRYDVYQETNFREKFYQLSTINDVYRYVDYYINQLRPKMLF